MFDVGAFELIMIAIVALVVIKPEDLPGFFKAAGNAVAKVRSMASEFRYGIQNVIDEAEREAKKAVPDPFAEERKAEGVTPEMSPEDITSHIMENRRREAAEAAVRGEAPVKGDPVKEDADDK